MIIFIQNKKLFLDAASKQSNEKNSAKSFPLIPRKLHGRRIYLTIFNCTMHTCPICNATVYLTHVAFFLQSIDNENI